MRIDRFIPLFPNMDHGPFLVLPFKLLVANVQHLDYVRCLFRNFAPVTATAIDINGAYGTRPYYGLFLD